MKNNYFEVNCNINNGATLSIRLPMTVHNDFNITVSSGDEERMANLVELFGEYNELDNAKRKTFQALILARANEVSTLVDLLNCMKAVRLSTTFVEENE